MTHFKKITESPSLYDHLEQLDTQSILQYINQEDQKVPQAVARVIPQITNLVNLLEERFYQGGRLFYIGADYPFMRHSICG